MAIPKEHTAKKVQRQVMAEKANESPAIYAQVGDGGGTVATGRANFYYIRLRGDENRVTQCYSLVPLADGDLIYVRQAQDRKLRWYEFVEFIQTAGGGTGPPVAVHNVLGAYHGDAATAAIAQGDMLVGDATPEINRVAAGNAHEIWKMNAGGTDPNWEPFDWDEMSGVAGADMEHDHSAAIEGGQDLHQIQEFEFDDATILTINAGAVTRTQVYHIIAAQVGVADDLDNVLGGVEGDELVIRPDTGDTITVRHNQGGAGDFWFASGANIVLDNQDHLRCIHDGTSWCDQSGGAGVLADHTHNAAGDGGDDLRPETISSQGYLVGPGCVHTTLGAAVVAVNAAGPPASGTEYTIKIMAGTTTEAGDVTIPGYCTVEGAGENTIVDMGGWTLYMSDESSLLDLVVLGTDTATLDINNADCLLRNVRVVNDGSGSYVVYIYGDSNCQLYDVVVQTGGGINYGILVAGTATPLLVDCTVDDATNFTLAAIGLSNSANVVTIRQGKYRGSGDDIWTGASSTLYHFGVDFRPVNSTFGGTHTAQPTKRFNQWVYVAEQGGDFQLLSEAITWINALGDAATGKRYGVKVVAGNYAEAGNVTVPSWVTVEGCGEDSRIEMGSNVLSMSDNSALLDLRITGDNTWIVDVNSADCILRNVHVTHTGGGVEECIYIRGDSDCKMYDCVFDADVALFIGIVVSGTATVELNHCISDSAGNLTTGLYLDNTACVATTNFCVFGQVVVGAAGTWYPHLDQVNWSNCTLTGTVSTRNTGEIKQDDDADMYPDGDTAGLSTRGITMWGTPCEDFRGAFGWLTTGWAGAPFNGTPSVVDFATYPDLAWIGDDTLNDRFFRYRTINYTIDTEYVTIARLAVITDSYVGIRLDTGDDNDFAEIYLSEAGTGLVNIVTRYQENGAGITTTTAVSDLPVMFYLLRLRTNTSNTVIPYYGVDTPQTDALGSIGDIDNWSGVPTRVGIIFQRTAAVESITRRGIYDTFDTDIPTP